MGQTLLIILNLIILEGLLSVDNAAVLAVMVKALPEKDRRKALTWGMGGAYIARGLFLFIANLLLGLVWLKIVGGVFLMWLFIKNISKGGGDGGEPVPLKERGLYKWLNNRIGLSPLAATIIMVELLDITFSMDNIFAAVALSPKLWVVCTGVFIGILVMRFIAGWFVKLMAKHPSLEASAYIVIGVLGLKLVLEGLTHYIPSWYPLAKIIQSERTSTIFSILTMVIFFFPLIIGRAQEEPE